MNILLDILGSILVGSIIMLMMIKLNIFASNANYYSDNELKMQQNTKTLADIVSYDLRKVGYNYDGVAIILADENHIQFYADIDMPGTPGSGVVDVVEYFVGDSTEVMGTQNPRDRVLYRVINYTDTISGPSLGLVKFKFSYLNSQNINTTHLDSIKYIKAEMWVEPYDEVYNYVTGEKDNFVFTYWELTINPRNI